MNKRILLIYNKEGIYRGLEDIARINGLNAEFAYQPSFREAIEYAKSKRVNAVVTDLTDSNTGHPFHMVFHVLVNAVRRQGYVPIIGYPEEYDEKKVAIVVRQGIDAVVQRYGAENDHRLIDILSELLKNPELYKERPLLEPKRLTIIPSSFNPDFRERMLKTTWKKGMRR